MSLLSSPPAGTLYIYWLAHVKGQSILLYREGYPFPHKKLRLTDFHVLQSSMESHALFVAASTYD